MRYQVTGYCLENPENSQFVTAEIDAKLFDELELAKNVCLLALGLEEKFQLVIDNYSEWEVELLTAAQQNSLWPTDKFDSTHHRILLARRLVNVLTGFRLYLDQTDHALSEIFENPSDELEKIKQIKCQLYDSYFGYRFLEALRNHVQHCDLPIEVISYDQKPVNEKSIFPGHSVIIPKVSFESLSENKKFKSRIIEELQSGPKEIDLRPHVREYISCLIRLHQEIEKIISPTIQESRAYYEGIIKQFSEHEGKTVSHTRFILLDDDGKKVKTVELYKGFLEIYDTLKVRNSNIGNVTKLFASNIVI